MTKKHYVRSQSDPKVIYDVQVFPDMYCTCTCPQFEFRGWKRGSGECKHISFILNKYYATSKMPKRAVQGDAPAE